ncbi:4-hydroxy-tetrahydrodipicolinate synthase [Streptomyces polygonati]|uniref:4-hydroxy-tetrahydrodipicolinate synthase n=1 Tax=Streptomyces polygonati TaxID=1617087 RepID=A0ABV8HQX7_9ACTN
MVGQTTSITRDLIASRQGVCVTITKQHVSGVILPLVTPFSDGKVDEKSLTQLVARYRATGITGVVLAGTTGESPVLSGSEVQLVVEHVAGELDGALPVYLGVSGNDTRSVAADIASYDKLSVDGYLVAAPYYNRPSQAGLSAHFDAVARQTDRAVIVYNIPYRTGVNLENSTLLALAERHSNVVGVKDSSGDIKQSMELIREGSERLAVMTGEDHLFFACVALGGAGGILASAHVLPERFVKVYRDLADGRREDALSAWNQLSPWIPLLFNEPNPVPLKAWLAEQGIISSAECRLPLAPATPGLLAAVRERLPRDPAH